MDMTVAQTILDQLGGRRFRMMTGASNFIGSDTDLSFRLPGTSGFVAHGINAVRVTLTPADTYTMVFLRVRGGTVKTIETCEDIYCDMLQDCFTRVTGLATRL